MTEEILNYRKLYTAYLDCRRNKRKTTNALKFELDLEKNLFDLQKELESRKYIPGVRYVSLLPNPPLEKYLPLIFVIE